VTVESYRWLTAPDTPVAWKVGERRVVVRMGRTGGALVSVAEK
jgi:LPS O-antigen subunit length determinant protein (WzzB/FepE family)